MVSTMTGRWDLPEGQFLGNISSVSYSNGQFQVDGSWTYLWSSDGYNWHD